MKTGVICYVKTNTEMLDTDEVKKKLKEVFKDADLIEVAIPPEGEEDLWLAWWNMTRKGMGKILLRFVEIGQDMKVSFAGKEMRLCG